MQRDPTEAAIGKAAVPHGEWKKSLDKSISGSYPNHLSSPLPAIPFMHLHVCSNTLHLCRKPPTPAPKSAWHSADFSLLGASQPSVLVPVSSPTENESDWFLPGWTIYLWSSIMLEIKGEKTRTRRKFSKKNLLRPLWVGRHFWVYKERYRANVYNILQTSLSMNQSLPPLQPTQEVSTHLIVPKDHFLGICLHWVLTLGTAKEDQVFEMAK